MFKKVMIMVAVVMMVLLSATNVFAMTASELSDYDAYCNSAWTICKGEYPKVKNLKYRGCYEGENAYCYKTYVDGNDGNSFIFSYIPNECEYYINTMEWQYKVYCMDNKGHIEIVTGENEFADLYCMVSDKYFNGNDFMY